MRKAPSEEKRRDQIFARLGKLAKSREDRVLLGQVISALDAKHNLIQKAAMEPGVEGILTQMFGRIGKAFGGFSHAKGKRILDIACGSNTSKAPPSFHVRIPLGETRIAHATSGYTALFEPWFCRILLELGADPVGVDLGDLEGEAFEHYRVDLGQEDALAFFASHSFDAVQDSRLFGSPEFTFQFPHSADRFDVAQEIRRQERRLLKPDGILIHSDAEELLR